LWRGEGRELTGELFNSPEMRDVNGIGGSERGKGGAGFADSVPGRMVLPLGGTKAHEGNAADKRWGLRLWLRRPKDRSEPRRWLSAKGYFRKKGL